MNDCSLKFLKKPLMEVFQHALETKTAVVGFNFNSLEIAMAIAEASDEMQTPVLLMVTQSAASGLGWKNIAMLVNHLSNNHQFLYSHWDHGYDYDRAIWAVDQHFDSVMYDGSQATWEDNVKKSQAFVQYARAKGVWTECEIGQIGGKEDDHESQATDYTSLEEALTFHQLVKSDMLAIALGTAHGFYKKPVKLNFSLMQQVSAAIKPQFLVLHGCTGLEDGLIQKAIQSGITKINYGTGLKKVAFETMKQFLAKDQNHYDLKKLNLTIIQAVKQEVKRIMHLALKNKKI